MQLGHYLGLAEATHWLAVGMLAAVQQGRQQTHHGAVRAGFLLGNRIQLLLALDLQHLGREARVLRQIGEQGQAALQLRAWHIHPQRRQVLTVAAADDGTERIAFVGNLEGVTRRRALEQQIECKRRCAGAIFRIRRRAGVNGQGHLHEGHRMTFHQQYLEAIAEFGTLDFGEAHLRRLGQWRQHAAIDFLAAGSQLRIRLDAHRVVMFAQPMLGGAGHLLRRGGCDVLQTFHVAIGIAIEGLALGEDVGAPAHAAKALHAARKAGQQTRTRARQRVGRRAFFQQFGQRAIELAFSGCGIGTRLDAHLDDEGTGQFLAPDKRTNIRRQLGIEHEATLQGRALTAGQQLGENFHVMGGVVADRRQMPDAINALLRDAVLHAVADVVFEFGHPGFQPIHRRARRDHAEVLTGQLAGFLYGDVAGQYEHGIVRSVVRRIPLLDVLKFGGVEVFHAADR